MKKVVVLRNFTAGNQYQNGKNQKNQHSETDSTNNWKSIDVFLLYFVVLRRA